MTTNACSKRGFYPENPSAQLSKAIAFAGALVLGLYSGPLHAAPTSGGDAVRSLYNTLLSTMKNGRTLGQSGRFAQLEPVIRRSFDIAAMARLSVGPTWASLTDAQRQQLTESFGRYMSAIYADRFDSYAGQKLEVTGQQPAPSGIIVKSQIVKANGELVKVDYMMRLSGDNWLISDIYLDGAISEVATRRSEFAAILKTDGIDGLISALNRKTEVLAMNGQNLLGIIVRIPAAIRPYRGGRTMTAVELFPADIYNQRTISQGHPADWTNRTGGEYDLVVVGGGPAGLVAAMTAAAGGHRAAMTEQRLTGGTCVNFGCTPSKALIRCARAVYEAGRGAEFGFRLSAPPRVDFAAVMERVRRIRSMSSAGDAVPAVEQTGAEVYLGHTRFTTPDTVEVDGSRLHFRKAVIATGSDPLVPPIDGLRTGEYLTNESVFSLTELPARLVVIGGGPLACELAQAFRRLGSEVDLVGNTQALLPNDEPEVGALIHRRFEQEGVRLHLGSKAVRAGGGRLTVEGPAGTRELHYDALLLGTGRKANVEGLNLEAANVRLAGNGVEVDQYLRTTNPNIYAVGDVTFPQKFTHAAMATARLCVANALDGAGRPARELVVPHCTYTDPEVAQVGLTPRQARDEGIAIDEYRLPLAKVERAFIDGEEEGFAVIYTGRGTGEIVGATLVAAHAGEMISELTLAMTHKVPIDVLAETIHCYPTQAEVFQRIALQYATARKAAA